MCYISPDLQWFTLPTPKELSEKDLREAFLRQPTAIKRLWIHNKTVFANCEFETIEEARQKLTKLQNDKILVTKPKSKAKPNQHPQANSSFDAPYNYELTELFGFHRHHGHKVVKKYWQHCDMDVRHMIYDTLSSKYVYPTYVCSFSCPLYCMI